MEAEDEGVWLCENSYTLPLGFWVGADFEEQWDVDTGKPADVQNNLTSALNTEPDVYKRQQQHCPGRRRFCLLL